MLDLVVSEGLIGTDAPEELDVAWAEETDSHYDQVDVRPIGAAAEGKLIDLKEIS